MMQKPRKPQTNPNAMHGKFGRHFKRSLLGWDTTGKLPSYHYLAAKHLRDMGVVPNDLRKILKLDAPAATSMLAKDPSFIQAYGEYLTSRWGQRPENRVLCAACADQEHPIYTPRPKHLWLLHGVIGGGREFTDYMLLVLHAQFERKQSTRHIKRDNFFQDYLAIMSLIALSQPDSRFAAMRFGVQDIRRFDPDREGGPPYFVRPAEEFDFSLNEYRAALGARLRRGDMMGMRGEVLEIAQSILLAI
jgi:hypothetical protein